MENSLNTYTPDPVSIPGATIKDLIAEVGITQKEFAAKMKMSSKAANELIKGASAITPEAAMELENIFHVPAGFWLKREKQYL